MINEKCCPTVPKRNRMSVNPKARRLAFGLGGGNDGMLKIEASHGVRHCDGLTRRDILRAGELGFGGLSLPGLFALENRAAVSSRVASRNRARSVILLFLSGGPSHLDMFDLKPDAPEEIRGTFRPVATRARGMSISEHLPRMARVAD